MLNDRKFAVSVFAALGIILLLVLPSCAQSVPHKITILHTNDMHGSYLPAPASWLPEKPPVGGFVALDYYVKRERAQSEHSLLLDAGDVMTGTLICDMKYQGAFGGALFSMMNDIGYDGWVFGNHEFDKGATNLRGLLKIIKFPVFCANFVKGDTSFVPDSYHIYDVDGLRVGVIGITYHNMVGMAAPDNLDGFISLEPAMAVNKIVKEIDSQTDLIIVLSHIGVDNDRELAENVKGVDLIVGGHSHTRIEKPELVNGVIIVQTGSNCRNLGRIDLTVAGDSVMEYSGKLIPMLTEGITPDPKLSGLVDSIKAEIDKSYGMVIAQLKDNWETQYRAESNIGDWLADAVRNRMGTDVAFLNSGGIRKNLAAGPITKMDIYEILPFDNSIVTFSLTGADLIKIAANNVGLEQESYQGSLQISGLSYTWQGDSANVKMVGVNVNGKPVEQERVYSVASIDYVADANADKYFGFTLSTPMAQSGLRLTDIVMEAVEKAGIIESKIDGRARKVASQ